MKHHRLVKWLASTSLLFGVNTSLSESPPTLLSPSNGASGMSISPTLTWSASSGAIVYRLQLSTSTSLIDQQQAAMDTTSSVPVIGGNGDQRLAQVVTAGLAGFLCEIRIPIYGANQELVIELQGVAGGKPDGVVLMSYSGAGTSIPGSRLRSFVFSSPIFVTTGTRFAIVLRSTGTSSICRGPIGNPYSGGDSFYRGASDPPGYWNAASYDRQDLPFQTFVRPLLLDDSTLIATSRQVGPLTPGCAYYWRVSAHSASGMGDFSLPFSFATAFLPPPTPAPVSPPNAAVGVTTSTKLIWNPTAGATSYRLQLATDSLFSVSIRDRIASQTQAYHRWAHTQYHLLLACERDEHRWSWLLLPGVQFHNGVGHISEGGPGGDSERL
jgi:hypothetical protein